MSSLAIMDAFSDLPDARRTAGRRHQQTLCLALFTLAVAAGNRGFLAIGDWLKSYHNQLLELFNLPKHGLPSYSTIRRVLFLFSQLKLKSQRINCFSKRMLQTITSILK